MDNFYSEYLERIRDSLQQQSALGRLSRFITLHTYLGGKRYSFKGHEYQEAIADSRALDVVVIKPSQVGLTELMTRMLLAFLAVSKETVAMLILPTVHEVQRAVKSRVDPVILGSTYLSKLITAGNDSSSFKQIGASQLVSAGSWGKAIISVPTDLLVVDELDFCNAENITTAESRLSHSRFVDEHTGSRGIKRKFSTPTVDGVGVSALFTASTQHHRLVKCRKCSHEFWPDFLKHAVVDGYDGSFQELNYLDVLSLEQRGLVDTGKLLCERCHVEVDLSPENRRWVATYPDRRREGFQVSPFDLPTYHSVPSLLRKLLEYRDHVGHFRNFTLGVPYSDSSNSIDPTVVDANTVVTPIAPEVAAATGVCDCVAGLDVGMTSWFVVGKPLNGKLHILWAEQIKLRGPMGDGLEERVLELLNSYGVTKFVLDNLPYTDTVLRIREQRPSGWVLPNMYTLSASRFGRYEVNENKLTVSSNRTKTLDYMVKLVNSGGVQFPTIEEMRVVKKHLTGIKRVDRDTTVGEQVQEWIKSGDDHYAHALNYACIAYDMAVSGAASGWAPVPSIAKVVLGRKYSETNLLNKRQYGIVMP